MSTSTIIRENIPLSVIIASRNSKSTIERCLQSLEKQANPDEAEIIVVDSSEDGTAELVSQEFPFVRLFKFEERKFPGDARNIGVLHARGEILAFTDADCFVNEDWIKRILETHNGTQHPIIGGAVANGNPDSYIGWAYYFAGFSAWTPQTAPCEMIEIPTTCLTVKRWAFEKYGPFLEKTYCSDSAFNWEMGKRGFRPLFTPSIRVSHINISHLGEFLHRKVFHGKSFAKVRMAEEKFSKLKRLAYGLISPVLPGILFYRIARRVIRRKIHPKQFVQSSPLIFAGVVAWSWGEFLGYLSRPYSTTTTSRETKPKEIEKLAASSDRGTRPLVSVVVEGYNESLSLGTVADTLDGLLKQDFPLNQVEVVLVGSNAQAEEWEKSLLKDYPFFSVKTVGAAGAHYYELKNQGAQATSGQIIALLDSDVRPESNWISSIVQAINNGADVAAGVTLFRSEHGLQPDHPLMQVAASISWGFVVGDVIDEKNVLPAGFLSHNVAFRADVFRQHYYRTDLGRTCAGSFLYKELMESGAKILFQPNQRVAHTFSLRWWILRLHRRFGYEVFLLRRLDETDPKRWVASLKIVEPLVTMGWHMLLDIPHWFKFSRLIGIPLWRRMMLLPVVTGMSACARGSEMIGMYRTMAAPQAMKRFAESN